MWLYLLVLHHVDCSSKRYKRSCSAYPHQIIPCLHCIMPTSIRIIVRFDNGQFSRTRNLDFDVDVDVDGLGVMLAASHRDLHRGIPCTHSVKGVWSEGGGDIQVVIGWRVREGGYPANWWKDSAGVAGRREGSDKMGVSHLGNSHCHLQLPLLEHHRSLLLHHLLWHCASREMENFTAYALQLHTHTHDRHVCVCVCMCMCFTPLLHLGRGRIRVLPHLLRPVMPKQASGEARSGAF